MKRAYEKAMREDPEWKAYVRKKRAAEKSKSKEQTQQANITLQGGELGFFLAESPPANTALSVKKPDQEHSLINHDHSMFHQIRYDPIRDRWLIDTGAQVHISNNRSLFIEFQETESSIRVGDTETMVGGIGTVLIYGVSPRENETPKQMMLFNVRYSPGFHTNIISHGRMFSNTKAFLNFEEDWIQQDGVPLYAVYQDQNLPWLVQPGNIPLANSAIKKPVREPAAEASIEIWHRRLGHVSKERIVKLTEMTEGVHIAGSNPENQVCEACQLANAPRQISRRKIGQAYGVLGRVHFDLVQNQPAYNRHVWLTHFYLDGIRCHFVFTHAKKKDCQWAVRNFIALI